MRMIDLIEKKKSGLAHTDEELSFIVASAKEVLAFWET